MFVICCFDMFVSDIEKHKSHRIGDAAYPARKERFGKAVTTNCACLSRMTSPQALRRVNSTPYRGNKAEPRVLNNWIPTANGDCFRGGLPLKPSEVPILPPTGGNEAGYERGARSGDGAAGHGGGNPALLARVINNRLPMEDVPCHCDGPSGPSRRHWASLEPPVDSRRTSTRLEACGTTTEKP